MPHLSKKAITIHNSPKNSHNLKITNYDKNNNNNKQKTVQLSIVSPLFLGMLDNFQMPIIEVVHCY